MGKMNKNPGKRWQELLGLTVVPFFEQDTFSYQDDNESSFTFDPDTMSLINPIDIENGLYNKNAFDDGLYTPMYDENDVFLGYAYQNDDFAYLDNFLNDGKYHSQKGSPEINIEKGSVTARFVSMFISDEFTTKTQYELSFTYECSIPKNVYRNVIFFGYDEDLSTGYRLGIDIPAKGFGIETFVDDERTDYQKYDEIMFGPGVYEIKIIRNGDKAAFFVDGETIGMVEDVERNTIGLWNWGGGLTSIKDIYLKEGSASPRDPVAPPAKTVDISVTATVDGEPMQNTKLSLVQNNEEVVSATTGSVGGCTWTNVQLGTYQIWIGGYSHGEYYDDITVDLATTSYALQYTSKPAEEPVPKTT